MTVHTGRAPVNARRAGSSGNLADFDVWMALATKPRRRLGNIVHDWSFVVLGWIMLFGLFEYPIAHLIGLAVCSLALLLTVEPIPSSAPCEQTRTSESVKRARVNN